MINEITKLIDITHATYFNQIQFDVHIGILFLLRKMIVKQNSILQMDNEIHI